MQTKLTPREIAQVLYSLHADLVDEDVMLWMPFSLEDMGDLLTVAITIAGAEND